MKTATVKELKTELQHIPKNELIEICLRLSKFKKENKELLTYLLFESHNEPAYVNAVKMDITAQFEAINTLRYFYIKKSVRKILRMVKKYIRYSKVKETEIELLLFFCHSLATMKPSMKKNQILINIYQRQIALIKKKMLALHEDLQYDYNLELEELDDIILIP